jgi:hypothetical protein
MKHRYQCLEDRDYVVLLLIYCSPSAAERLSFYYRVYRRKFSIIVQTIAGLRVRPRTNIILLGSLTRIEKIDLEI